MAEKILMSRSDDPNDFESSLAMVEFMSAPPIVQSLIMAILVLEDEGRHDGW